LSSSRHAWQTDLSGLQSQTNSPEKGFPQTQQRKISSLIFSLQTKQSSGFERLNFKGNSSDLSSKHLRHGKKSLGIKSWHELQKLSIT
jgi:hypothetical protein